MSIKYLNASNLPVYDVMLIIRCMQEELSYSLGTLGPTKEPVIIKESETVTYLLRKLADEITGDIGGLAAKHRFAALLSVTDIIVEFTDGNGIHWVRMSNGYLTRRPSE